MMIKLDYVLDRITMYRLVLYTLLAYLGVATILAFFHQFAFSPLSLALSTGFLVVMCWAANTVLAYIFKVPTNLESATITALILALIIDPAKSPLGVQFLGWAAILAMASKYLLAIQSKHIFNPAAIAVVITSFVLGESASWWVGTGVMLPFTLAGGLLIARKLRQIDMVAVFAAAAILGVVAASLIQGTSISREVQQLVVESPLFFFGTIMLTEPLTSPPTKDLRRIYGALTGILIVPAVHIAHLYSTPELALVAGNLFAFIVSPKYTMRFRLKRKNRLSPDIVDFILTPTRSITFAPGQYMEWTLAHPHPDSRGNRRFFTIASSPTEGVVRLGVRFYQEGSTFKRALWMMDGRTRLLGAHVAGDFTLPKDAREKLVFIAGGIGITPFRSMLKYLVDTRQKRNIILFYVNRNANDFIYKDVLGEAQTRLGVRTIYTLTDTTSVPANWQGAVGRLSPDMIREAAPDFMERTFYLSGPPSMVHAYERVLKEMGVRHRQIKTDFFPGLV